MKQKLFISLLVFYAIYGVAQDTTFVYSFNNCTGEDDKIRVPGVTLFGSPTCECGIGGNCYLFGENDYMTTPPIINAGFSEDFTFDFYFTNLGSTGDATLFSHSGNCVNLDTIFNLRYNGSTSEYQFEMSSSVNNYFSHRFSIESATCWHRFTLVKFSLEYFLYIDGELVRRFIAKEVVRFSKVNPIYFGERNCPSTNVGKFVGAFDQISLKARAISAQEVSQSDVNFDRITTPQSTLIKGDSITLQIGQSCGNPIDWVPSNSLNQSMGLSVVATPLETTTYIATSQSLGCISRDTVKIFVTSSENIDCSKILLPRAFTPNGDGLNDFFYISNKFIVEDIKFFEIYARNGSKVWEAFDASESWDGTMNGNIQQAGTYMYRLSYTCDEKPYLVVDNFVLIR